MARKWQPVPIQNKYFANAHETVLTNTQAAIENAFHNEAGGLTRFPGLTDFTTLADSGKVYLSHWRDRLMATTADGRLWRIDEDGNAELRPGESVTGNRRVTFSRTRDYLLMAAGDRIFAYDGDRVEVLSEDAPLTTHVGFIDSYVLAAEKNSGRFNHSEAGVPRNWPALDVFSADTRPDDINFMIVTEYGEILIGGWTPRLKRL